LRWIRHTASAILNAWPTNSERSPRDANQLGKMIVDISVDEVKDRGPTAEERGKDPAAAYSRRLGGLKGGKARAKKLSPKRRASIARTAAKSRWARRTDPVA
jgi:hypothetical protein